MYAIYHNNTRPRTTKGAPRYEVVHDELSYALAITTGGKGSTFAFFLLGVLAPLPFFGSPPVLEAVMSGSGGGGPGVARGASPSIPPGPDGPGAGGFALLFFLEAFAAGVTLLTVPSGPILACDGLGASSGRMMTDGSSGAGAPNGMGAGARLAGVGGRKEAGGIAPEGVTPGGRGKPGSALVVGNPAG